MLGPLHTDHYLREFARFDASPRARLGWNWAACLCTLNWMLLRRLWVEALLYVAALAVAIVTVLGLARLALDVSKTVQLCLAVALATIAFAVPGALGNTWLYRALQRRNAAALRTAPTLDAACARLARLAPTRQRVWGLAAANAIVAALAVTAWVAGQTTARATPQRAHRAAPRTALPAAPASAASVAAIMPPRTEPEDFRQRDAAMARYVSRAPAPLAAPAPTASATAFPDRAKRAPPADVGTRYRINIAVFADADNARRATDRLQAADIAVDTDTVETPHGTRTRLRAGPYATRAEADATAARIHALRLEAVVAPAR